MQCNIMPLAGCLSLVGLSVSPRLIGSNLQEICERKDDVMFNVLPSNSGHNWELHFTSGYFNCFINTQVSSHLGCTERWKISLLKVVSDQITNFSQHEFIQISIECS